jgi:hypothetical protein
LAETDAPSVKVRETAERETPRFQRNIFERDIHRHCMPDRNLPCAFLPTPMAQRIEHHQKEWLYSGNFATGCK